MRGLLYTTSITCSFLLNKHKLHFSVALQSVIVNQKRPVCSAAAHWQQPNCHQPLKERPSSVRAASIRKCRQFLPSSYSHPVSGHQAWYAPAAKADARVSSLSIGLPSQAAVPAQLTLSVRACKCPSACSNAKRAPAGNKAACTHQGRAHRRRGPPAACRCQSRCCRRCSWCSAPAAPCCWPGGR